MYSCGGHYVEVQVNPVFKAGRDRSDPDGFAVLNENCLKNEQHDFSGDFTVDKDTSDKIGQCVTVRLGVSS